MVLLKKLMSVYGEKINFDEIKDGLVDIDKWANPKKVLNAVNRLFDRNGQLNPTALKSNLMKLIEDAIKVDRPSRRDFGLLDEKDRLAQEKIKNENLQWTSLSSSWIQLGMFETVNKAARTGNLTIMINSDNNPKQLWYGPYTYPGIKIEIWELMQQAKGKNGTGAGSVFWRYWLHKWLPSQVRAYVKSRLAKRMGLTHGDVNNILRVNTAQLIRTRQMIFNLEKGFRRTKVGMNSRQILSQQWQQRRINTIKRKIAKQQFNYQVAKMRYLESAHKIKMVKKIGNVKGKINKWNTKM